MHEQTTPHRAAPERAPSRARTLRRAAGIGALALAPLALATVPALPAGASGGTREPRGLLHAQARVHGAGAGLRQDQGGGRRVTISPSFGPSGTQATAVVSGLPANLVNFSLEPDMKKLVKAGLVSKKWNNNKTKGMVTDSIVSFVVRKGNPHHINSWADLVKSGVSVITPNVFSSGSAKWNIMAAYGSQIVQGKSACAGRVIRGPVAAPHRRAAYQRERGHADLPLRAGHRAPRLRGRRALRPEEG